MNKGYFKITMNGRVGVTVEHYPNRDSGEITTCWSRDYMEDVPEQDLHFRNGVLEKITKVEFTTTGPFRGVSTDLERFLQPIALTDSSDNDHRDRLRKLLKDEGYQELVLEENQTYRDTLMKIVEYLGVGV
jgi:hypothetical protein